MKKIFFLLLFFPFVFAEIGWVKADSSTCHNNVDMKLDSAYNVCTVNCRLFLSDETEIRSCNSQCYSNLRSSQINTESYGRCKSNCFNNNGGMEIIGCFNNCSSTNDTEQCFLGCSNSIDSNNLKSCVNNCYFDIQNKIKNIYDYSHLFCNSMLTIGEKVQATDFDGRLKYPLIPMDDYYVISGWYRTNGGNHFGIDYVPYNKNADLNIYSSTSGVVSRIESGYDNFLSTMSLNTCISKYPSAAYGNRVHVKFTGYDGNEYEVLYGHFVKGSITVNVGDDVEVGQVLGKMGNSGCSTGTHLHYEIRKIHDGTYSKIDPYDIYESTSFYPDIRNGYSKECGENHLWETCPID